MRKLLDTAPLFENVTYISATPIEDNEIKVFILQEENETKLGDWKEGMTLHMYPYF